jgi:hypothetical protein
MTVRVHFIEHNGMSAQGISAITATAQPYVGHVAYFTDQASFEGALRQVEAAMQPHPDDIHMVVICTHGTPNTGTWLDMGTSDPPFPILQPMFRARPPRLFIYFSVCWGGYNATITRAQRTGQPPWPPTIGALVNLRADEGDALQDDLLRVLLADGIDETKLGAVVANFNNDAKLEYGQHAARIARSDGTLDPPGDTAGLSWPLLRDANDVAIEGPFTVVEVTGRRASVTEGTGTWQMPVGRLEAEKGAQVVPGDRFTFKAKVNDGNLVAVPPIKRL